MPEEAEEDLPATHTDDGVELAILWRKFRDTDDMEARNSLVEYYVDIVRANAESITRIMMEAIEDNDLYQAGMVGFLESLNVFDPDKDLSFEDFSSLAVRKTIMEELQALIGAELED